MWDWFLGLAAHDFVLRLAVAVIVLRIEGIPSR